MPDDTILINRAPVLTLWAAVVAERMGYDGDTALSLGKAVAGLNAQSKGRMLGIYGPPKTSEDGTPPQKTNVGEEFWIEVCGRGVPAKQTENGIRAVVKEKEIQPESAQRYLEGKFGNQYRRAKEAMEKLAASLPVDELHKRAYSLYEKFRPDIPKGKAGWGAKGEVKLDLIRSLAG
jgi:hypothetical protein